MKAFEQNAIKGKENERIFYSVLNLRNKNQFLLKLEKEVFQNEADVFKDVSMIWVFISKLEPLFVLKNIRLNLFSV